LRQCCAHDCENTHKQTHEFAHIPPPRLLNWVPFQVRRGVQEEGFASLRQQAKQIGAYS